MQISFSAEKALIEKIDAAGEKLGMSRSSLIAELLKWAVEKSPLIKEGKLFEAVPPTKDEFISIVQELNAHNIREIERLEKRLRKLEAKLEVST